MVNDLRMRCYNYNTKRELGTNAGVGIKKDRRPKQSDTSLFLNFSFKKVVNGVVFIIFILHNEHSASSDAFGAWKSSLKLLRDCVSNGNPNDRLKVGQNKDTYVGSRTPTFRNNALCHISRTVRLKENLSSTLSMRRGGNVDSFLGRSGRIHELSVVEEEWSINPFLSAVVRLIRRNRCRLFSSFSRDKEESSMVFDNSLLSGRSSVIEKSEGEIFHTGSKGLTELVPDGPATNRVNSSVDASKLGKVIEILDAAKEKEEDCLFYIREARYKDLTPSASILYDGFFDPKSLFKSFGVLKILDRLQSNYPYGDREHFMFVAAIKDNNPKNRNPIKEEIIGFADVDARFMDKQPPKPYLSDLAVHPRWRRKGVARALMMACERKAIEMGFDHLYLRVDLGNEAAIQMYGQMEYDIIPHHLYGNQPYDTTLLLKRNFSIKRAEELSRLPLDFLPCQSQSLLLGR